MGAEYGWQKFYEAAVLETDITTRRDRIFEARLAIQHRLADGLSRENDATELAAIDYVLAGLKTLEIENVGG